MAVWGEKVYVPAIMGASGITKEQAKTCLYYAVATHLLPEELDIMPILAIVGPQGTGKSDLITQLSTMVKGPDKVGTESISTLRDGLNKTITALIDEGGDVYEKYLIQRYAKGTSVVPYKKGYGSNVWKSLRAHIFGATIIARRIPFKDAATTSRSIIIRTVYNPGDYRIKYFRKAHIKLGNVASKVSFEEETSERIRNNWMPLQAIARYLGDKQWLKYSYEEIKKSTRVLKGSQKLEPEHALLMVLREKMIRIVSGTDQVLPGDVTVGDVRKELKSEFDCYLSNTQIIEICQAWGFKVVSSSGYPKVKFDQELLEKLCKEKNLKIKI